jgi:hypothetical protein
MSAETLPSPSRRFRGSTLDHRMGAVVALAAIGIPPFVIGYWGVIYALVVVNLFLALALFRTPDPSGFGRTGTGMTSLASAEAQPEGDHHD